MNDKPTKLDFNLLDYLEVIYSWIFAFKETFIVKPGLYYTGDVYDIEAPLIVTCNYHMTVFRVWQFLKGMDVRILVIDTDGINVWCSSGKGKFSAKNILQHLVQYDDYFAEGKIEIILPKLSLSGVNLQKFKNYSIKPIIGPIYAQKLPEYLSDPPYQDRIDDKYRFNLHDRLFTLIPSLTQIITYSFFTILFLWGIDLLLKTGIVWQVLPVTFFTTIFYITFFSMLPSEKFAIKGLFLAGIELVLLVLFILTRFVQPGLFETIFYFLFIIGFNLFFGLYYTGNSGVSNYSLVKNEIIRYLPISFTSFLLALIALLIKGFQT